VRLLIHTTSLSDRSQYEVSDQRSDTFPKSAVTATIYFIFLLLSSPFLPPVSSYPFYFPLFNLIIHFLHFFNHQLLSFSVLFIAPLLLYSFLFFLHYFLPPLLLLFHLFTSLSYILLHLCTLLLLSLFTFLSLAS
jgi:hypothetical protein